MRTRRLLFVLLLPMLAGCASLDKVIAQLAKDPATACITVTTIYGTIKVYRTALPNGSVSCNQDGLAVKTGGADGTVTVPVTVPSMRLAPER